MTTLLATFLLALLLALILTPLAGKLGELVGALDTPGERKVHDCITPRTGGLAVFVSMLVALAPARIWGTDESRLLKLDVSILCFMAGA